MLNKQPSFNALITGETTISQLLSVLKQPLNFFRFQVKINVVEAWPCRQTRHCRHLNAQNQFDVKLRMFTLWPITICCNQMNIEYKTSYPFNGILAYTIHEWPQKQVHRQC